MDKVGNVSGTCTCLRILVIIAKKRLTLNLTLQSIEFVWTVFQNTQLKISYDGWNCI